MKKIWIALKRLILLSELNIKEPKVHHDFHKEISNRKFEQKDFEDLELWQQLYYEQVFEALGYSRNKEIMLKLSKSADIKFFKSLSIHLQEKKLKVFFFMLAGCFRM